MVKLTLGEQNIMELVSTLAHERALDETIHERQNEEISTYKDENADILEYTDEFQDIFNRWYDYYWNTILEYSKNN